MDKRWLTDRQAAEYLNLTFKDFKKAKDAGKLPKTILFEGVELHDKIAIDETLIGSLPPGNLTWNASGTSREM